MRANPIVLFQPELYDTPRFRHGIEQPSIQTAVPEYRIETFIGPVLPGTARVNVMGAHLLVSQPVLQDPGDQFRPIVTLDTGRYVNRKLKCPLFRILKCPLVDKEIAVSIILCISPYLATVPVSLQAHVPTTRPCASLSTGNSPP